MSLGLVRSRDKLKTYLHYQIVYDYQTWHKGITAQNHFLE